MTSRSPRLLGLVTALVLASGTPPLVIAHRGASADAPEHTFAAYDRAVRQGADVLECDLQLTSDDVLVCMHDTTVDRTAGSTGTGRVDGHTLAELRAMDFGAWFGPEFAGQRVVTFEEQLRRYGRRDRPTRFYAETKAPAEYGGRMEPALVRLLRRLDLVPEGPADPERAPVIVQSFDLASLQAVKRLAPSLPTAWLWLVPPPALATGVPDAVDVLAPAADWVRGHPEIVDQAHASGHAVHVWTVDDGREMDELVALGVDGIFTNTPAVLRARVGDRAAGPAASGGSRSSPGAAGGDPFPWPAVVVGGLAIVAVALGSWFVRRRTRRT